MKFNLRVCRHCGEPVSLHATSCSKCHGKLMSPRSFAITLIVMGLLLFVAFTGVVYAYLVYNEAYESAFCSQSVYARAYVAESEGCFELCTNECTKRNSQATNALLITRSYTTDRTDVQVSCDCTCSGCFEN